MLKDEMGIAALGKRMRIQNGIVELKRPISTNISSMPLPIPGSGSPSLVPSTSMNAMATSPISNFPVPAGIQQQQLYNFNGIPVPGGSPGFTNAPFASPALSGSFHSGYGYAPSGGGGSGRTPSIEGPMVMPGNASPYAGSVISEDVGNGGGAKDGGLQPSVNVFLHHLLVNWHMFIYLFLKIETPAYSSEVLSIGWRTWSSVWCFGAFSHT